MVGWRNWDTKSDIKETPTSQTLRDRIEVRGQGPPLMGRPGSQPSRVYRANKCVVKGLKVEGLMGLYNTKVKSIHAAITSCWPVQQRYSMVHAWSSFPGGLPHVLALTSWMNEREPVWGPVHQISLRVEAKSKSAASLRKSEGKSQRKSNHAPQWKPLVRQLARWGQWLPYVTPAAGERWGKTDKRAFMVTTLQGQGSSPCSLWLHAGMCWFSTFLFYKPAP